MSNKNPSLHIFNRYRYLAKEYYSGKIFIAFDTETTGIKSSTDFLIEIGAVKFSCDGIIDKPFSALIKPPVPITNFIENLTHITNEMVENQPEAKHAVTDFLSYIGNEKSILIAHNAPFDLGFLQAQLERMSFPPLKNQCIDTLPLARLAYPKLRNLEEKGKYTLQSLAKRFGIKVESAHRACDDARVCMELFKKIIQDTLSVQKDYNIHSQEGMLLQKDIQLSLF